MCNNRYRVVILSNLKIAVFVCVSNYFSCHVRMMNGDLVGVNKKQILQKFIRHWKIAKDFIVR